MDAIVLLKKYNLYDDAQAECRRKKLDSSPYDMQGHNKVYCSYLSKKWRELRDEKDKLTKIKCIDLDNIPNIPKPAHNDCWFVCLSAKDYCKEKCTYYKDNIAILVQGMNELSKAEDELNLAAEKDYWSR